MNTLKEILKENITQMGLVETLSLEYIALVLGTALVCGMILYLVYKIFYQGAVYSENFGLLIVMTTLTVAFIIMTISSNIVLSLGMVGALSIVRFRTAVKDPLDVGFLFLAIAAGLTAGAGLFLIAGLGTVAICTVFVVLRQIGRGRTTYLLVADYDSSSEDAVMTLLNPGKGKLKSKATDGKRVELTWLIRKDAEKTLSEILKVEGVRKATLIAYTGDAQY
ncbi:MAG: DUF4956 domain-containing protein [Lachnospiraceae bacterium]|nr:DUF4956 domain-containing protein [Lachnospiraceae bacterium]